jgi:hypothetical protein
MGIFSRKHLSLEEKLMDLQDYLSSNEMSLRRRKKLHTQYRIMVHKLGLQKYERETRFYLDWFEIYIRKYRPKLK